ncbi:hypothetical protein SDC9_175347 [bioreactor metagenome]|uniref:Uncharacterized protein n=1 Tax=bioreactor metagenome TaxID=1076179 RepID=A0A645GW84_9ZZZZ
MTGHLAALFGMAAVALKQIAVDGVYHRPHSRCYRTGGAMIDLSLLFQPGIHTFFSNCRLAFQFEVQHQMVIFTTTGSFAGGRNDQKTGNDTGSGCRGRKRINI